MVSPLWRQTIAMFVRQEFSKRHYNPLIVFPSTSFVASLISGVSLKYNLGNDPQIALASSVLLLVPGFPLINSLADILKRLCEYGIRPLDDCNYSHFWRMSWHCIRFKRITYYNLGALKCY